MLQRRSVLRAARLDETSRERALALGWLTLRLEAATQGDAPRPLLVHDSHLRVVSARMIVLPGGHYPY